MANNWTCSNCGCVHWDGVKPISCIMCDNDEFLDGPEKFYNKQTNYIKDKKDE
jgi:hypothetical protein